MPRVFVTVVKEAATVGECEPIKWGYQVDFDVAEEILTTLKKAENRMAAQADAFTDDAKRLRRLIIEK